MKPKLLKILLIDDQDVAINQLLNSCIGSNFYQLEEAKSYDIAEEYLHLKRGAAKGKSFLPYDLILLDINLGDEHPWGGVKLLVKYWAAIKKANCKVLIYSNKSDVINAYEHFNSDYGPFRFHQKMSEQSAKPAVVGLLRERVKWLCLRASFDAQQELSEKSETVTIDGEEWSIGALLAPWNYQLPHETVVPSKETLIHMLFPKDNLVRIFSYWFKARAFWWSGGSLYGLQPLEAFHCNKQTGPMDALTHEPSGKPKFEEAAVSALKDLETLSSGIERNFYEDLKCYIDDAMNWKRWSSEEIQKATSLKDKVMFQIPAIEEIFEDYYVPEPSPELEVIKNIEFYCPPAYTADGVKPKILHALERLSASIKGRSESRRYEIDCRSIVKRADSNEAVPYLVIKIAHNGPGCPVNQSPRDWFVNGHDLDEARKALRGAAQWYIVARGDSPKELKYYSVFPPWEFGEGEAETYRKSLGNSEEMNVLHIIKIGIPFVED